MQKSNSTRSHFYLITSLLVIVLSVIAISSFTQTEGSSPSEAEAEDHILNYSVDRSALPKMNYYDLTLNVYVGSVASVEVKSGNATIPSTYNSSAGTVNFTTDATSFSIELSDFTGSPANVGELTIAPLRDNKLWAWSHGFDDNAGFLKAIYEFEQNGVTATLYLNDYGSGIGSVIEDDLDQPNPPNPYLECNEDNSDDSFIYDCWMIDGVKIRQLLNDGWAIGNHTENHLCTWDGPTEAEMWQDILNLDPKLKNKVIAPSNRPDYIINSFAEPCSHDYNGIIQARIQNGETDIIMNEGGQIDYTVPSDYAGATNRIPLEGGFPFSQPVVRDIRIEGAMNDSSDDAQSLTFTKAMFDWLHNNSSENGPITHWYNTISHQDNHNVFSQAIPYLINTYGPNSQYDEVWIATAEEIFSYQYTKEFAQFYLECSSTVGNCQQDPLTIPDAVPGPRQIHGRVFNDANRNGVDDYEVGIPNVRVVYWNDANCDSSIDFSTDYGFATLSSDSGSYTFDGLDPNQCYQLQIDLDTLQGGNITEKDKGPDNRDSDFYDNGFSDFVSLPANTFNLGLISANSSTPEPNGDPTKIEGRVFRDQNSNGLDDNEPGIESIRMVYWNDADCDGDINTSSDFGGATETSSNGSYSFTDLNSNYCYLVQVDFSSPSISGLYVTAINAGSNDAVDNDFFPNGYSEKISLPTAAVNLGLSTSPAAEATSTPESTPTPSPTPTTEPTSVPSNFVIQEIFTTDFNPIFSEVTSRNDNLYVLDGKIIVNFRNDYDEVNFSSNSSHIPNVVALSFDVLESSPFTQITFLWIEQTGNDTFSTIEATSINYNFCAGNYVMTENIPENVVGFVIRELSDNKLTEDNFSFQLDNIIFLTDDTPAQGTQPADRAPECTIDRIYLPSIVREPIRN
ncbi:MAG: SdrD B-like domain-containing protein [Chloroflexota bacterium]